ILVAHPLAPKIFTAKEVQYLETIQELYRQQEEMYFTRTNSIVRRIVSIHQPFIRPIVRGKDAKKVEFGSKINVSLMNGYTRINQFDYDAFNESLYVKFHNVIDSIWGLYGFLSEVRDLHNVVSLPDRYFREYLLCKLRLENVTMYYHRLQAPQYWVEYR
ncbi:MAG: hypothetical protein ACK5KP_05795, partial [Paludibacteraceae bacterium]